MSISIIKKGSISLNPLEKAFSQLKKNLPVILSQTAAEHFIRGFRTGGGQTDAGMWVKRKRERRIDTHTRTGRKREPIRNRAILVLSGDLRNSIQRRKTSFSRTIVGSYDIKYANIHNKGGQGIAYGLHPFTMPKREFIGKSTNLERKMRRIIDRELRNLKKLR